MGGRAVARCCAHLQKCCVRWSRDAHDRADESQELRPQLGPPRQIVVLRRPAAAAANPRRLRKVVQDIRGSDGERERRVRLTSRQGLQGASPDTLRKFDLSLSLRKLREDHLH